MARDDREVVVVERGEGGALKWLVVGVALGAGLALLFAPKTGKEMRRDLKKGIRRVRDLADDTIAEFRQETANLEEPDVQPDSDDADDEEDAEGDEESEEPSRPARPSLVSAREELERRLAAARARRQAAAPEEEEPVA